MERSFEGRFLRGAVPQSVVKRARDLVFLRISFALNLGVTETYACCDSCWGGHQISSGRGLGRPAPFPEAGLGEAWVLGNGRCSGERGGFWPSEPGRDCSRSASSLKFAT